MKAITIKQYDNKPHEFYVECSVLCEEDHSGEYVPAAQVRRLVEICSNDVIKELEDLLHWLGPCDHEIGHCECHLIRTINELKAVLA